MMKNIFTGAARVGAWLELPNEIARTFPRSVVLASLADFTEVGVEGIFVAAPGALNAEQAVDALERGGGMFRRKPPRRIATETHSIADATHGHEASSYEVYGDRSEQDPVFDSLHKHPKESTLFV